MDEQNFIELLSITDPFELCIIKSLLDSERIVYYLKGENTACMEPVGPVRLMVKREHAESVKKLLELQG